MPVGALGIYLFTNQMAVQPIQLLSSTLQTVLAPYAARVRGDIDQEDLSVRQTFLTGVIFVPLFVMGIAAVYPSLAHLLFAEKWNSSIIPVQCACVFLIYPTVQTLLEAPLMGARRWTITLELFGGRMIGKLAGAALSIGMIFGANFISPIPETQYPLVLVIGVGVTTTIISFFQIKKVSKQIHISNMTFRYEMYSTPAYSILAAVATSSLASSVVQIFGFANSSIRIEALLEVIFCIITYGGVCAILLRFGYVENLNNLLQLFPQTPRRLMYKVLFLEEKSASLFQKGS
jgi:O-antigen/teichoic acid export membrane protein